jgi:CelD/BcsL family acetyltransferase involved in cellulose biosynthesis
MLQVSLVTRTTDLSALRDEWSSLFERSESATVFDTFDWIWTWWELIGKRGLGNRLYVVLMRDDSGVLVGIAPFYSKLRFLPIVRQLNFLGSGMSDYHDVLAQSGSEGVVSQILYDHLAHTASWSVADLNQLREGGILRRNAPDVSAGLVWKDLVQEECPYLSLPDASDGTERWDDLLKLYSKKMRANVRYYDRALDRIYSVKRHVASSSSEVKQGLEALFVLHQRRWNQRWLPGVFYSKSARKFHLRAATKLQKNGYLRLHSLQLDDCIEAVLYCFSVKGTTSYYQGGFEPTLAKLSLGSVITGLAIRLACEESSKTFDFLRGDEPYKRRWTLGSSAWNHRRIIARKDFFLYPFTLWLIMLEQRVEQIAKERMHHHGVPQAPESNNAQ